MDSYENNQTWDLLPRSTGNNIVKCRWVYQTKFTFDGVFEHRKDHLVMKGLSQQEWIDYTETFYPIAKMNLVRLILSLAARFGWPIHEMDIKSAFLHGDLFEDIFMEQPLGFMTYSSLICWLKKLLHGLNQAPRAWYEKIDQLFFNLGFKHCEYNHNIYVLHVEGNTLILVVYVDDPVLIGNNSDLIFRLKCWLSHTFEMIDLGILHFFLGLQVLPL